MATAPSERPGPGDDLSEPVARELALTWASIAEVGRDLSDAEWDRPTELPGWTVKDCVSHIIGVERSLLGEPAPRVTIDHLAHVQSPFAAAMEADVEARRSVPAADVLAELDDVASRRIAALGALTAGEWDEVGWSPTGEVPHREFMAIRVFDCWMHEQDMRRVLDRPGHLGGPAAQRSFDRCAAALGYAIGKLVGLEQGSVVRFVISPEGPEGVGGSLTVEVTDRARLTDDPSHPPDLTVTTDLSSFAALCGGRWDAARARSSGRVVIDGDADTSTRVLDRLAFTP